MGTPLPLPKGGGAEPPKFSVHVYYCGQTAGCIKMPLGMEVGLISGDFVLDGHPARIPKKWRSPQFSAHIYCGQTAEWIKISIGTEVGLRLRDIVLDRDQLLSPKGAQPPVFGQCPLWPNGWMD